MATLSTSTPIQHGGTAITSSTTELGAIELPVKVVVDHETETYYIEAHIDAAPAALREAERRAGALGLEVMYEDEAEPEVVDATTVRYWLALTNPTEV